MDVREPLTAGPEMPLPTESEVLVETERELRRRGRVALAQLVRTEGSTPGKVGWKLLVRADGSSCGNLGGGAFEALVKRDATLKLTEMEPTSEIKRYYLTEDSVRGEATGMVCGGLIEVFMEVLTVKPLLVICGGGPVGQALAWNSGLCGFETLVADDREEFRQPDLFPDGTLVAEVDRDYETDFLGPYSDRDVYLAVVSRCWETDLAALTAVLRQPPERLRYLGLMGSERKIARVRQELAERGFDLEAIELSAPIGLPIGGDTPGELAVSILAEMIDVRSRSHRADPDAVDTAAD